MDNHDWTLVAADKRGRERTYLVRDVGIVAALEFQRGIDTDALAAAVAVLDAHVVSGDWQSLTIPDAIRLASRVVSGEATEGKSSGSESGPA